MTFIDEMIKTLVMKNNTLMLKSEVRRLIRGYPGHLERLIADASDEEKRIWGLFKEFILVADDRWESKEAREAAAKEVLAAEMAAAEAATDGEGGGRGGREKRRRGCVD
ncbi:hypothetical protein VYU27_010353 [Nannochloropsis oceanica]